MADDDARDDGLAHQLQVEPLDEVTRRRLVATALREGAPPADAAASSGSRIGRLVAAASVAVILVAGGLVYLTQRDSEHGTTAARNNANQPASTASRKNADASTLGESGSLPARDLGDAGDLHMKANLDRLRTRAGAATANESTTAARDADEPLAGRLARQPCAANLPAGTIVAVGTARFGSRDAIVVVTDLPDGSRSLDAVVLAPCEVRPLD
jgi:hypothetical protein